MRRETQNVIQLSVGYFWCLLAWNQSVYITNLTISAYAQRGLVHPNAGYFALAIIYASLTTSTLASATVVRRLGARVVLRLCGGSYAIWQLQFLIGVREWQLYAMAAGVGLMGGCKQAVRGNC